MASQPENLQLQDGLLGAHLWGPHHPSTVGTHCCPLHPKERDCWGHLLGVGCTVGYPRPVASEPPRICPPAARMLLENGKHSWSCKVERQSGRRTIFPALSLPRELASSVETKG